MPICRFCHGRHQATPTVIVRYVTTSKCSEIALDVSANLGLASGTDCTR